MVDTPIAQKKYGNPIAAWITNGDSSVDTLETIVHVFKNTDFKKRQHLLPALDGTPFKHPLDTRFFAEKIKTRIETISTQINGALFVVGIAPDHPQYCDRFVREFYRAALPQYDDGGLCLGYPNDILKRYPNGDWTLEPELTAKEAFDGCLDTKLPFGSCTESTYKIISAIEMATGGACPIEAVETEDHTYARFRGKSPAADFNMDPSALYAKGWHQAVNPAALYYAALTDSTRDFFAHQIAHALEPVMHPDRSPQYDNAGRFKTSLKIKDCLAYLDNWAPYVRAHPQSKIPFTLFNKMFKNYSPAAAEVLAMAYIERFPESPYAGLPLMQLHRSEADTLRLAQQVSQKYGAVGWGMALMSNYYRCNGRQADAWIWAKVGAWFSPHSDSGMLTCQTNL